MDTTTCPQCGKAVSKALDECNFCGRQLKVPYEPLHRQNVAAFAIGLLAGVLVPFAQRLPLGPIFVMLVAMVGFLLAYPTRHRPFGIAALITSATFFVFTVIYWYILMPFMMFAD